VSRHAEIAFNFEKKQFSKFRKGNGDKEKEIEREREREREKERAKEKAANVFHIISKKWSLPLIL